MRHWRPRRAFPDHAGSFVLCDHAATGGDNFLAAAHAVRAMPVSTSARMPPCQTSIAEVNRGSTAGLQKLTGGPSSRDDHGLSAMARDAHVAAARRKIDVARLDDLAIDGFARRPMTSARQMLGENGRESGRHMLRDEHGKAVDHRADFADQAHQRTADRPSTSRPRARGGFAR